MLSGQFDEAEVLIKKARDLRPWNFNSHVDLAQIKIAKGEFKAAAALAEALPERGHLLKPWHRSYLRGHVASWHYCYLVGEGREEEARELAAKTVEYLDACLETIPSKQRRRRQRITVSILHAKLHSTDDPRYVESFLVLMKNKPLDPFYLKSLDRLLGAHELSARAKELLRDVIRAQAKARAFAPGSK